MQQEVTVWVDEAGKQGSVAKLDDGGPHAAVTEYRCFIANRED